MLTPNHPHDERLAALASADADAIDDAALASHVATCAQCAETVTELGVLRASLADLPDLRPSRPLQLVPGVERDAEEPSARPDRLTGWVRRLFGPVMAVGATLALVGLVGTTAPVTSSIFMNVGSELAAGGADAEEPAEAPAGEEAAGEGAAGGAASSALVQPMATSDSVAEYDSGEDGEDVSQLQSSGTDSRAAGDGDEVDDSDALTGPPAERSPWPMVLFSGVALVIGALLLRWIVVPRAG
jgi:hypothetical protein